MSRTIKLHQLCYTSLPPGVTGTSGWQTFARSLGLDMARLVEPLCVYERPRSPASRTDEQMPVDFGFRYLDASLACVYRICFAGADEFGRRGNYFAHAFVLSRADLDAIDADIPALLSWAQENGKFFSTATEVIDRYPDGNFDLEVLEVDTKHLRDWRRGRDAEPLVSWLGSYPPERRERAIRDALRTALAPPKARRPVVWVSEANGMDNSRQELEIIYFLFAALPFAWRRLATFSTYRKVIRQAACQWVGTVAEGPGDFSEEQRLYQYYIVNHPHPQRSSTLPSPDCPWINEILDKLDKPFDKTALGRTRRFANHLLPGREADVYEGRGFLWQVMRCDRVLEKGYTDEDDLAALFDLLDTARDDRPEVLDRVNQFFVRFRLKTQDWARNWLGRLAQCYHGLAVGKNLAALADQPRRTAFRDCCAELLDLALQANTPKLIALLLTGLRTNKALTFLRKDLMSTWLDRLCADVAARPTEKALSDVLAVLEPYFGDASADDRERQQLFEKVRQSLCQSPHELASDLIQSAERTVLPFCRHHIPGDASELEKTLNLFAIVRDRDGPDLIAQYLLAVCRNVPDPNESLSSLRARHRYLLLQYSREWQTIAGDLSPAWQQMLREVAGAALWSCFWESSPRCQPDLLYRRLAEELREARIDSEPLSEFAAQYTDPHALAFGQKLEELSQRSREATADQFRAYAVVLETVRQHRLEIPGCFREHLLGLLALLYRDGSGIPPTVRKELLGRLASVVRQYLGDDVGSRWEFYLDLCDRIRGCLRDGERGERRESDNEWMTEWYQVFAHVMEDEVEGIAVWSGLIGAHSRRQVAADADPPACMVLRPLVEKAPQSKAITRAANTPFASLLADKLERAGNGLLETLRNRVIQALNRPDELDLTGWVVPSRFGWWLLKRPGSVAGPSPPEPILAYLDWKIVSQLHKAAREPEAVAELTPALGRAFSRVVAEVEKQGRGFPHDCWAEIAHTMGELPGGFPELLEESRRFLRRGIEALKPSGRPEPDWRMDLRSRLILGIWFADTGPPQNFWNDLCRALGERPSHKIIPMLACTNVKGSSLGEEAGQLDLALRTRLAERLWRESKPSWFASFLAQVGDKDSGDEEPVPSEYGCEASAYAVGSFLRDSADEDEEKRRVEWLVKEKWWHMICKRRALHLSASWDRFCATLQVRLQNSLIPADKVSAYLHKKRP